MPGLFGDEFDITLKKQDINSLIKKANNPGEEEDNVKKVLKSSAVSLEERLAIIKQRVLETLGKQAKNVLVIKDRETLHNYISDCIKAGRIAIDTETNNSLDPVTCKLMGPCFYAPGLKQAYVPLNHVDPNTHKRLEWQLTENDVKEELQRVLDAKTYIVMHNGKFDYEVIKCTCGIAVSPNWDTIIGARILDENEFADAKTSLKYIYTKYIDPSQAKYDIEELFENIQYALVDPEIFALYAATDSMMTDKVYLLEIERFNNPLYAMHTRKAGNVTLTIPGLKWVFENIEMPIVTVTAEMELAGVCVDTVFGERLKYKYNEQLAALDNKISAQMKILKPLIKYWKLLPLANRKTKVFQPKKSKLAISKIEEKYPYLDLETGKRYKWGKAKALQIDDEVSLSSPTQLAILFYDIFKCPAPSTKKPRGTGEDELIKLSESLKEYADIVNKSLRAIEKDLRASRDEKNEDALAESGEDETVIAQDEKKSYEEEAIGLFYEETEQIGDEEEAEEVTDTGISVQITKDMPNQDIKTLIKELTPFYIAGAQALQAMCQAIIDRRGIMKLITTYIDVIPDLSKHWPDGRIRFHLNSMGTDTGRYSSGGKLKFFENDKPVVVSGINIQNIPSHNKEIRMLFKAQSIAKLIEAEDNEPFIVPEISEVETPNGFKYCKDISVGDDILVDGATCSVTGISYNAASKEYVLEV